MDTQKLVTAGLQPLQAQAYALLLESGRLQPSEAASRLELTRTNAYKVLDKLVELELAIKIKEGSTTVYRPANPIALSRMVAQVRNEVTAREEAVNTMMGQLMAQFFENSEQPTISVVTGKTAVADSYRQQAKQRQPIYFVRTQADIPALSFDIMHEIRMIPTGLGIQRYGITPDVIKGPTTPANDKRGNLTRTWVKHEDYTAPVEWSVSGNSLLIILFGAEPHAITIINPIIALAFRQLWQIMDGGLRAMSDYSSLPRTPQAHS